MLRAARLCMPAVAAALLLRPALAQDRAAELRARLARESSPVQKAKLMPRLGEAEFLQIASEVAAGRIPEALRGLEQFRGQAVELSKELDATGINAEKKPAGFKQLQISLRESLARMDSLLGSLTADQQASFLRVRNDLDQVNRRLIQQLFPEKPNAAPGKSGR